MFCTIPPDTTATLKCHGLFMAIPTQISSAPILQVESNSSNRLIALALMSITGRMKDGN